MIRFMCMLKKAAVIIGQTNESKLQFFIFFLLKKLSHKVLFIQIV